MPENPYTHREMAPMSEVFGGTKATPAATFQKSRIEQGWDPAGSKVDTRTPSNARPNDLALECPRCAASGKPNVRMFERAGVGYYCQNFENQHIWKDWDQLMDLHPKKIQFVGHAAKQDGHVKVDFTVPGSILETLQRKYGARMQATLAACADVLAGDKFLMIGEHDMKRLADKIGQEIPSAQFLIGKLFEWQTTATDSEASITKLKVQIQQMAQRRPGMPAMTTSMMMVDLGDELLARLVETAEKKGMKPEDYIATTVEMAITGDWV